MPVLAAVLALGLALPEPGSSLALGLPHTPHSLALGLPHTPHSIQGIGVDWGVAFTQVAMFT